jgi:hypothetical protein
MSYQPLADHLRSALAIMEEMIHQQTHLVRADRGNLGLEAKLVWLKGQAKLIRKVFIQIEDLP